MFKKALIALAMFLLPVTGAFAQTASQDIVGFLLAAGSTYSGYTCPSSNITPCFVPYGSSLPVTNTGTPSTLTSSAALAANTVVCSAACGLTSFEVSADSTLSGAPWWIMIYNATSAPVDGAVTPSKCYAMTTGTSAFSAGFPYPITYSTGVVIGVSTTGCFTKTASTHAFVSGDHQ